MTTLNNKIKLQAIKRENKKKAKAYRADNKVPAVLYGKDLDAISIVVDNNELRKVFTNSDSQVIDLELDNKIYPILIYESQRDPITNSFIHVDFYQVSKDTEVHAEIPIDFIGVSPAVKDLGGVLLTNVRELSIRALPDKLIPRLEISIDNLADIGAEIKVKDLKLPEGIIITLDPETSIALVTESRTDSPDTDESTTEETEEAKKEEKEE